MIVKESFLLGTLNEHDNLHGNQLRAWSGRAAGSR